MEIELANGNRTSERIDGDGEWNWLTEVNAPMGHRAKLLFGLPELYAKPHPSEANYTKAVYAS